MARLNAGLRHRRSHASASSPSPLLSAVPQRIMAQRDTMPWLIDSCRNRNSQPHNTPNSGIRNDTVNVRAAPMHAMRRKNSR